MASRNRILIIVILFNTTLAFKCVNYRSQVEKMLFSWVLKLLPKVHIVVFLNILMSLSHYTLLI